MAEKCDTPSPCPLAEGEGKTKDGGQTSEIGTRPHPWSSLPAVEGTTEVRGRKSEVGRQKSGQKNGGQDE